MSCSTCVVFTHEYLVHLHILMVFWRLRVTWNFVWLTCQVPQLSVRRKKAESWSLRYPSSPPILRFSRTKLYVYRYNVYSMLEGTYTICCWRNANSACNWLRRPNWSRSPSLYCVPSWILARTLTSTNDCHRNLRYWKINSLSKLEGGFSQSLLQLSSRNWVHRFI